MNDIDRITVKDEFLINYAGQIHCDRFQGVPQAEKDETIVLDYGNPNVAKPLHVGHLRSAIIGEALKRIIKFADNREETAKKEIAEKTGIAAIKFGDLINHYSKDYVFDPDKFMASEGKTGVYLLYTVARIQSILRKADIKDLKGLKLHGIYSESPNIICDNAYQIAAAFSKFYHESRIISETDNKKRTSWLALCVITKEMLIKHPDTLAIETVDVM